MRFRFTPALSGITLWITSASVVGQLQPSENPVTQAAKKSVPMDDISPPLPPSRFRLLATGGADGKIRLMELQ